jgi:predicted enzyme related to lactoylglutathione lyase
MNGTTFFLLASSFCFFTCIGAANSQPTSKEKSKEVDDPTKKNDRLRQPGFLFLEIDCHDLTSHIDFFKTVAGYELNRKDGNFVILRSERGEILLNGVKAPLKDKPARYQGPRVEIGIVVGDLDKSFAQTKTHKGWTIAANIVRQSWGVRDFRVYSPEGYYFRITEGPK